MLNKLFKLEENNTTIKTEVVGGIITFMTMAYIIFIQPQVLSITGMDAGAVMMATCLSAALATFVMGFLANYPIANAPGMGENFVFLTVAGLSVGGVTLGWQGALAAVLFSGVAFVLMSIFRIREKIINSIPDSLKHAIAVGIGLLITIIGLNWSGIIRRPAAGLVEMGDLSQPAVLLATFGLLLIAVLMSRKVKGAILWGMLLTTGAGLIIGLIDYHGIIGAPPSIAPTFFKFNFSLFLTIDFLVIAIIFLFMDLFDTIGTLVGVTTQAGLMKNGKLPRAGRALMSDAIGTVAGSVMGTSTVTSYIESSTGIAYGARTGLANIVTGFLFLLSIFFAPLVKMIGQGVPLASGATLYPITAPVLIIVGCLMMKSVKLIQWEEFDEAMPAFLVIVGMPLTYSPANGMAFGFIAYPVLKFFSGKGKDVSALSYALGGLFLLYLVLRQIILV